MLHYNWSIKSAPENLVASVFKLRMCSPNYKPFQILLQTIIINIFQPVGSLSVMHVNTVPLQLYKQIMETTKNTANPVTWNTTLDFYSHHFILNHSTDKRIKITEEKRKKKKRINMCSKFEMARGVREGGALGIFVRATTMYWRINKRSGGPVSDYTARYELSTIEQTMAGETLAVIKLLSSSRRWTDGLMAANNLVNRIDIAIWRVCFAT